MAIRFNRLFVSVEKNIFFERSRAQEKSRIDENFV